MIKEGKVLYTCFACKTPLENPSLPCPKCGYQFTAGDTRTCPNNNHSVCAITENLCHMGIDYMNCPIKIKADGEDKAFDL